MSLARMRSFIAGLLGFRPRPTLAANHADELRHLGAPGRVAAAQLLLSIGFGMLTYAWWMDDAHHALRTQIRHADAMCQVWVRSPALLGPAPEQPEACRVASSAVGQRPATNASTTSGAFSPIEIARLRAMLESLGLANEEDEALQYNEPEGSRWKLLLTAIRNEPSLRAYLRREPADFVPRRTSDTLVDFARALATAATPADAPSTTGCRGTTTPALATAHADVLDAILGAEPHYGTNLARPRPIGADYRRAATGLVKQQQQQIDCELALRQTLQGATFLTRFGLMLRGASRIPDGEVLQALLAAYGVANAEGWVNEQASADPEDVRRQQRAAIQFLLALMSEVRAVPDVRSAQSGVTLLRGGEQLTMICLAYWITLMLVVRAVRLRAAAADKRAVLAAVSDQENGLKALTKWLREASARPMTISRYIATAARQLASRDRRRRNAGTLREVCEAEADALFNSAWRIRLGIALLPGIGFVGTVLGIMGALANVDAISRAPAGAQQAVEVSFVAGSLGLAFATTAIALIAGLILRVFTDWQEAREARIVTDLEIHLAPLLDASLAADVSEEAVPAEDS